MNSVVEKLAAIEKEVAAIQPKMVPLTERIADLHHKVTGFTQQLADLAAESVAVKQDVELTRQSLARIQTLIGESKIESEQLVAGQEENQQRCETMTAVFGAAFQAVSQFFEAAQQMGLADQAKAVFLSAPSAHAALPSMPAAELPPVAEPMPAEPIIPPPPPLMEAPAVDTPVADVPAMESPEPPATTESPLSESDFDAITADTSGMEETWAVPGLPDVAAPPEMTNTDSDSEMGADEEPSDEVPSEEMASHLDVPPLNLAVPAAPAPPEPTEMNETDEQEIEDMLATMMAPVTTGAGS